MVTDVPLQDMWLSWCVSQPISFPSVVLSIRTHAIPPLVIAVEYICYRGMIAILGAASTPSPESPQFIPSRPQSTSVTISDDHGDSDAGFPARSNSDSSGPLETDIVKTGMGSSNVDSCALARGEECETVFVGSCCIGWGGGRRRRRQKR